jgi:hypothetical protein
VKKEILSIFVFVLGLVFLSLTSSKNAMAVTAEEEAQPKRYKHRRIKVPLSSLIKLMFRP